MMQIRSPMVMGLDLIVDDEDSGAYETAVELDQFQPHFGAQLRIEVRQRLVHKEDVGLAHHRPAERHALTLSARQGSRLAVQIRREPQNAADDIDPFIALFRRKATHLQSEFHVLANIHMRVERIALEHHRDVAIARCASCPDLRSGYDRWSRLPDRRSSATSWTFRIPRDRESK